MHVTRPPEICVNLVFKHIHAAKSCVTLDYWLLLLSMHTYLLGINIFFGYDDFTIFERNYSQ